MGRTCARLGGVQDLQAEDGAELEIGVRQRQAGARLGQARQWQLLDVRLLNQPRAAAPLQEAVPRHASHQRLPVRAAQLAKRLCLRCTHTPGQVRPRQVCQLCGVRHHNRCVKGG